MSAVALITPDKERNFSSCEFLNPELYRQTLGYPSRDSVSPTSLAAELRTTCAASIVGIPVPLELVRLASSWPRAEFDVSRSDTFRMAKRVKGNMVTLSGAFWKN